MANEFVIKNGYLSRGDSEITGSLTVTGSQVYLTTDTLRIDRSGSGILVLDNAGLYIQSLDGNGSFDAENRLLYDSSANNSIDWTNRQLYKSDGTTVIIDWENESFTGSLYGTASWAENAITASYAITSSLPLLGIVTGSTSGNQLTLTKGDGSSFTLTLNTGSVDFATSASYAATASFITASNVYGPYGSNSIISSSWAETSSYADTAFSALNTPFAVITASNIGNDDTIEFLKGGGGTFQVTVNNVQNAVSSSYASTASYVLPLVQDVTVTGSLLLTGSHISEVDYIDFRNIGTSLPADQQGRIYWDDDNGTLSLGMHGGQVVQQVGLEEYYYIKNQTGTTLQNGSVIRAAGTLGASGRILGDLMIADGTIPYFFTLGIVTEDIVDGNDGYVTQFGLVRGINTTGSNGETWVDGDILYVSPTVAGTLTKFEPEAPNLRIQMAIVVDAATNGSIFVRPDLGSNVGSLHDVIDTTTTSSYGELFVKSGSVWTSTKQLTGSYGITGSLDITGSLFVKSQDTIVATNYPNSDPGEISLDTDGGSFNSAYVYLQKNSGDPNRSYGELSAMSPKGRLNFMVNQQSMGILVSKDTDSIQPTGILIFDSPAGVPVLQQGTYIYISGSNIENFGDVYVTGSLTVSSSLEVIGSQIISGTLKVHGGNVDITSNAYFFQGTNTSNGNVSLIGVNNQDQVYIGNQGYTNILADETHVRGDLQVTGSLLVTGSTNLNGSLTTKTTRITASSYTASINDYRIAIRYTDTGSVSVQLPLVSQVGQIEYRFKDEEGNATVNPITLVASGSNLIDGSSTALLKRNYIAVSIYNDGVSNWYVE